MPNAIAGTASVSWLVGDRGMAIRATREVRDGGQETWKSEELDSATLQPLRGVWATDTEAWGVGGKGVVRRFRDGAPRFVAVDAPATEELHGIFGFSSSDLWVVGSDGCILHFDGQAWTRIAAPPSPEPPSLYDVWGAAPDDVWIVGAGTVLHVTRAP